MKPTKNQCIVLKQICELIPRNLVYKLAKKHGVSEKSRRFSPWSHVLALLFAQVSHALSLNDICDSLRHHSGVLKTMRGASPPSRNGLSYASKNRNADMAEALFWEVLDHLKKTAPRFGSHHKHNAFPRRFKRMINIVDSTTIQLVSNCMDWAKHRRRKAAAKCHLRLNLKTFLPSFAVIKEASTHDSREAYVLCSGMKRGEIVVFDKAYLDFAHLCDLEKRGIFWVTRAKKNMSYHEVFLRENTGKRIIKDQIIRPYLPKTGKRYPHLIRLVTAEVDLNGTITEMTFLTNNLEWQASSICDLYKARWSIETFFKQLKQTLQLADFLGYSKQAVRWQIWIALLAYVLLRFIAFISKWRWSFSRLFTLLRGVLWSRFNLFKLLDHYGTAPGPPKVTFPLYQAHLPGMAF